MSVKKRATHAQTCRVNGLVGTPTAIEVWLVQTEAPRGVECVHLKLFVVVAGAVWADEYLRRQTSADTALHTQIWPACARNVKYSASHTQSLVIEIYISALLEADGRATEGREGKRAEGRTNLEVVVLEDDRIVFLQGRPVRERTHKIRVFALASK
jgi:hypothetical protein